MAAGNELPVIVWRAVIVLVVCLIVGRIVGTVAQHAIERHIAEYKQANPIPEELTIEELLERKQADAHAQAQAQSQTQTPNTLSTSQADFVQPAAAAGSA